MHLAGHVGGVATDVDVRLLEEEFVDLLGSFTKAVLYVNLLGSVSRKGGDEFELVSEDLLVLLMTY